MRINQVGSLSWSVGSFTERYASLWLGGGVMSCTSGGGICCIGGGGGGVLGCIWGWGGGDGGGVVGFEEWFALLSLVILGGS